jgi:hypothetical protein
VCARGHVCTLHCAPCRPPTPFSFQADPTENLNNFFTTHPEGIAQIILAIGIVEGTSQPGDFWWGKGEREAGAWSFDPTNFYGKLTQQKKNELTLKELKNGRLAMIAVAGYAVLAHVCHCGMCVFDLTPPPRSLHLTLSPQLLRQPLDPRCAPHHHWAALNKEMCNISKVPLNNT